MDIRQQAFAGQPLSIPVIDAHTHMGQFCAKGYYQNPDFLALEHYIAMQDKLGIRCCVTAPHCLLNSMTELANRRAAEAARQFPGRIYGYISIAPFEGMEVTRKNLELYGKDPAFVGLKFLGGYNGDYTEPEYIYALDFANEAGCPVLCHTWRDKPSLAYLAKVTRERPGLSLLLAHQGGGNADTTRQAAPYVNDVPNLYMELCGSLYSTISFDEILELVGEDNMIFGTDAINLDYRFDFGKLAFSTMPDSAKEKIFATNYLKLLARSQMGKIKL